MLLLFDEPEFRAKYPPTATTITTTTIMPTTAVLNAVRLPRANEGKCSDEWYLRPIFLKNLPIWALIRLVPGRFTRGETWKKFHSGTAGLEGACSGSKPQEQRLIRTST